jgi:hypothetical protein
MPETRRRVKVYEVKYLCDTCKMGYMERAGDFMLMSNPPQYPHSCTNCEATKTFKGEYYPRLKYESYYY